MQKILKIEDFSDKLGDTFTLTAAAGDTVDLRLAEVDAKNVYDFPGRQRDPFSLMFDGPPNVELPQGIHRLEHSGGEAYDIGLVPLRRNEDGGIRFQALFN